MKRKSQKLRKREEASGNVMAQRLGIGPELTARKFERAKIEIAKETIKNMRNGDVVQRVGSFLKGLDALMAKDGLTSETSQVRRAFWTIAKSQYLSDEEKDEFFRTANLDSLTVVHEGARKMLALHEFRADQPAQDWVKSYEKQEEPDLWNARYKKKAETAEAPLDLDQQLALNIAADDLKKWFALPVQLQANECSRLHKLIESVETYGADGTTHSWDLIESFVVKHDWLAAFGPSLGVVTQNEMRLPYPMVAFEFKFTGRVMIVVMSEEQPDNPLMFVECSNGTWFGLKGEYMEKEVAKVAQAHIKAICVMLDAEVAETTLVRQPMPLQLKRKARGKLPMHDYHVIDLSRRHRAEANPNPTATGRHVRCHFRRGHWRHFSSHRTWINWMMVGDPDLGFVDKEYKL